MRPAVRKAFIIGVPATLVAGVLSIALVEVWVRLAWDARRGTPGFYLSDPVLGQRLAPGYTGWFAGVPVRTNSLGFRDDREYALDKPPGTFRIIVLGDSVTFGHGALYETTYPYLVEQRLKAWRPDVNWQVWNLGVPGYNTSNELQYLKQIGGRYQPDLVVVGFYPNDFTANEPPSQPSAIRRLASAGQQLVQRHLYSYEFYKRAYLTARWRLSADESDRRRIEHLGGEEALLQKVEGVAELPEQRIGEVDRFDDEQSRHPVCPGTLPPDAAGDRMRTRVREQAPEIAAWLEAVRAFQQLHRDGKYHVVFFINMAPHECELLDRFFDGGSMDDDAMLLEVLGDGTPAVSSTREFLHFRPSQMPVASGHSLGNSNRVKADVLFNFLSSTVLPPLLNAAH